MRVWRIQTCAIFDASKVCGKFENAPNVLKIATD